MAGMVGTAGRGDGRRRWARTAAGAAAAGPPRGEWPSPLRGVWLTAVLGMVLLAGLTTLFVTGLLSYAAYNPDLFEANDTTPDKGVLGGYLFPWPTDPPWLYRLTQGLHVTLGFALVPVVLAKLWSVIPRLFARPPVRSVGHAVERLSLVLLVGGVLFEMATGVLNTQLEYVFPGSFYRLHFYGAWVCAGALVIHLGLRLPRAVRALRAGPEAAAPPEPGPRPVLHARLETGGTADGGRGAATAGGGTLSRRGALGMVGAGSLLLLGVVAGQSVGGPLRRTALLAPHGGQPPGEGPNRFQVNKTAASVGVTRRDMGEGWRLLVRWGVREVELTRAELSRMPQHTARLPIACVEGWSTSDLSWSGVRLLDLAELVAPGSGAPAEPDALVESVQRKGAFRTAALRANQVTDERSLLALRVGGVDLSEDHGYPARTIVPAAPGVLNTKWVGRVTFGSFDGDGGIRGLA